MGGGEVRNDRDSAPALTLETLKDTCCGPEDPLIDLSKRQCRAAISDWLADDESACKKEGDNFKFSPAHVFKKIYQWAGPDPGTKRFDPCRSAVIDFIERIRDKCDEDK